ncbi:MAG TPA: ABC transporter permease [Thermomicrobiales bacterium]|nr:ABC transporter permease [Thermomicrobiales bacterium]
MNLDYLINQRARVLDLTVEHLEMTLLAVAIALLFAIPLGIVAARFTAASLPIFGLLGAIYTIPSLAALALLIPLVGLGRTPAVIVLAAYAQLFLVRNIATGLRGVDPAALEAARGMGMAGWQVLLNVQVPLALPVIIAGVRIALVTTISFATITAWINAGGLGTLLFNGITRNNQSMILAGTIAVTALALLADQLMRLLERLTAVSRARRAAARE